MIPIQRQKQQLANQQSRASGSLKNQFQMSATGSQQLPTGSSLNDSRRYAHGAANLATVLHGNPIGQQIDSDPTRLHYQGRRQSAANSLGQAMHGLNGSRETMGSAAYAQQAGSLAQALGLRTDSAQALGQRAGSSQGWTDGFGVTTRGGVGYAGPSMGNQAAIDAGMLRPTGPIASVGLGRAPSDGSPAQPMHAQGVRLSDVFAIGDDPARKEAFLASRNVRDARRQGAHDIRREQMQQAQAQAKSPQLINAFQNPIALQAMYQNPELALGAINNLNDALQGRQRLQNDVFATMANFGLRVRSGMERNTVDPMTEKDSQANQTGQSSDQVSGPSSLDDVLGAGPRTTMAQANGIPQPRLRPVMPDPATGQVPFDAADNLVRELVSRGYRGDELLSRAGLLGLPRTMVDQVLDQAPGPVGRLFGSLGEALGLNPRHERDQKFYGDLGDALGRDYRGESAQSQPYGRLPDGQYFGGR